MPIKFHCPQCGRAINAPDGSEGRSAKCPACSTPVTVPASVSPPPPSIGATGAVEEVLDAQPMDAEPIGLASEPPPSAQAASDQPRRPCPSCGEMIPVAAVKCRFCNEVFDPELKRQLAKGAVNPKDATLSVGEWVVCILCSGIGCICGIVYMIQGKPKGGKMVGISFLSGIVWALVNAAIQNARIH